MTWSDETLMAFADGELDTQQRAELERVLAVDAALRQRVAAIQAQRERVAAAFAPVLAEPVPDRLAALLQASPPPALPAPPAPVVNLDAVRAAREPARRMSSWAAWGGMAASVLLGVLIGMQFSRSAADPAMALHEGQLVAGGRLAQALSSQLAGDPAAGGAPVAVQLSFVDKGGSYCRTFSTSALSGLACQQAGQWTVQTLVSAEPVPGGVMRQATTALPPAVLEAVDQRIAGLALDAGRERQARDSGWRR